ncbi:hypothetical protein EVAR_22513_1 [Eumeta japonica]|uniref:Uncharacterized protein n=1 Tax=Eumeta variegata TaxID=151549 RepID=A0A4C1U7Z1_EUMVA|nr:hypothetical protein EVAR_22513_1 [Eumeta japonica]
MQAKTSIKVLVTIEGRSGFELGLDIIGHFEANTDPELASPRAQKLLTRSSSTTTHRTRNKTTTSDSAGGALTGCSFALLMSYVRVLRRFCAASNVPSLIP